MKRIQYYFFLPASLVLLLISCARTVLDPTQSSGNWVLSPNDFVGDQRTAACAFTVGNVAYIGTGYNLAKNIRYSDLYSFDPTKGSNGSWTQLANAPNNFTPRSNAVAFAIGTNGYITTGQDNYNNFLNDTWQYNTVTNTWVQKASFAGTPRIDALAFSIGNLGYLLCGYDGGSNKKDSWQYDPNADTWNLTATQFTGSKRQGGIVFVYQNKAYIVTGTNNGEVNDFTVFDPSNTTNPWNQLRPITNVSADTYDDLYTNIIRDHGVGFVLGDSAYITTGQNGSYNISTWGYDFKNDLWFQKTNFERAGRSGAIGFSVAGRAFVTTGASGSAYYDDLNEWLPYQPYNPND
ncbi:Kelch repeat-containing protein [Hydrotalea sp.]|uniref:Kelch repeat-containing protein n=1 Tax=Hydrotalea sp. TaxID=2881279 RepID=UPI003D1476F2